MDIDGTLPAKQCEECGEDISENRLKVKPDAIYCVQCQEGYDRRLRAEDVWESLAPSAKIDMSGWGEK